MAAPTIDGGGVGAIFQFVSAVVSFFTEGALMRQTIGKTQDILNAKFIAEQNQAKQYVTALADAFKIKAGDDIAKQQKAMMYQGHLVTGIIIMAMVLLSVFVFLFLRSGK